MGKICDPPPFTGGQMEGVSYRIQMKTVEDTTGEVLFWLTPSNGFGVLVSSTPFTDSQMTVPSSSIYRATGKILGISPDYSRFQQGYSLVTSSGLVDGFVFPSRLIPSIYRVVRPDLADDTGGDPPQANCRCSDDSCRVDCASQRDGFCCIDRSLTDRLLQLIQN